MKKLYVLFDAGCAVCMHCRKWLERQPAFVTLEFIPLQSRGLARRFPGIESLGAFRPARAGSFAPDSRGKVSGGGRADFPTSSICPAPIEGRGRVSGGGRAITNHQEKLVVIADNGAVYRGASAWVMCLWALKDYRAYACRLSDPMLLPLARIACELFSRNRHLVSRLIFRQDSKMLARDLAQLDSRLGERCNLGGVA